MIAKYSHFILQNATAFENLLIVNIKSCILYLLP